MHNGVRTGDIWQMCPFEWFRVGQQKCARSIKWYDGHLCHHMPRGPQRGERVLMMVSTCARHGQRSGNQRSQIVAATWR